MRNARGEVEKPLAEGTRRKLAQTPVLTRGARRRRLRRTELSAGAFDGARVVQIVFDDGSTRSLASNTTEGQEFTDIARKLTESGL